MTNIFQNVHIDPDLRDYVLLSSQELVDLHQEAQTKPDPDAWLSETLNARGRAKKASVEEHNQRRMEEDKTFFQATEKWPGRGVCCTKEQPWVKANGRRFGLMLAEDVMADRWIVHVEGEGPETFESLSELVKVWSVD